MSAGNQRNVISISAGTLLNRKKLKLVLTYEANLRGLSLGKTLVELISNTVDIESYPPEVRARLDEIAHQRRMRAMAACGLDQHAEELGNGGLQ